MRTINIGSLASVVALVVTCGGCIPDGEFGERPVIEFDATPTVGSSQNVQINFTVSDADCSFTTVYVYYFVAGETWQQATLVDCTHGVATGTTITDIHATADGVQCTATWDTFADGIGLDGDQAVSITVRASDIDGPGVTAVPVGPLLVNNNCAQLIVAETSIDFGERFRGAPETPADERTITITNGTGANTTTLYYEITSDMPWLVVASPTGTVTDVPPYTTTVTLVADVDGAGLPATAMPYPATLTIVGRNGGPTGSPAVGTPVPVPVLVAVRDPDAEIFIHSGDGSSEVTALPQFVMAEGGADPASQGFWIMNAGEPGSVLAWSAVDDLDAPDWLVGFDGATTGQVNESQSVSVAVGVDGTGLSAGTYGGVITVSGTELVSGASAFGGDKTVAVSLLVTSAPYIGTAPGSFSFAGALGGIDPASQTLSITNAGEGALDWTVSDDASWLTLAPTSGQCTSETDEVTVSVDLDGVSEGTHTASITVAGAGATNTPVTIGVSLTVTASGLQDGLVAWWKLDETSGTTALDATGNGNHGTLRSGPVWQPSGGQIAGGLEFDGVDDDIKVNRSASLEPSSAITVALWGNITDSCEPKSTDLVRKAGHFGDGYILRWSQTEKTLQFRVDRSPGSFVVYDTQTNDAYLHAWHHYAATYDAASGTARLFVDGVVKNTVTGLSGNLQHEDDLYMMWQPYPQTLAVPGVIDDVRIYDRALSPTEVEALYEAGAGVPTGIPIERVNVSTGGTQADSGGSECSISANGRFVAFHSDATNLVAADTNGCSDVFVRDRLTGSTVRVSVAADLTEADGASFCPYISANGRYVAFDSQATNLSPNDVSAHQDVFVHDRETNAIVVASLGMSGQGGDGPSCGGPVSDDGRYAVFTTYATNMESPPVEWIHVYYRDTQAAQTCRVTTDIISIEVFDYPGMSSDGRYIAFYSEATTQVTGDTNGCADAFVYDRQTGTSTRVSVDSAGVEGNGLCNEVEISAGGRYVVFNSAASNLVAGDTNGQMDIYVHDTQSGQTTRASLADDGSEPNSGSGSGSVSSDGRYVCFRSAATNLVPGDTNGKVDIFVRDLSTGATARVSVAHDSSQADDSSGWGRISADGRYVAFRSDATNLVAGDTNDAQDVFVAPNPLWTAP